MDTGGDASDLITVNNGNWELKASSQSYSLGTIAISVMVTLSYVDPSVNSVTGFAVTITCSIVRTLSQAFDPIYTHTIGGTKTVIPKPVLYRLGCNHQCSLEPAGFHYHQVIMGTPVTWPITHTWFTETATAYEIETDHTDMDLVSQMTDKTFSSIFVFPTDIVLCGLGEFLNIKMVNPCDDGNGFKTSFITPYPAFPDQVVNLDDPTPLIYNPGFIADTYGQSRAIPTFCGNRVFTFAKLLGNGGNELITDLITVQANGDWHIQASS